MSNTDDVSAVWNAWSARQRRPQLCRLTKDRVRLITDRLRLGYTPDDLIAVVRYAYESDDPTCRFWRGDNDRGEEYLGLDNLMRVGKLGDRVSRALAWAADIDEPDSAPGNVLPLEQGGRAGRFRMAARKND